MTAPHVAIVGFGEVGSTFARELAARGVEVRVHSRPRADLDERVRAAGATRAASAADAAAGADVTFLALPADCDSVVEAAAGALGERAIAVDLSSAAPDVKARRARLAAGYVDAAILGTVAAAGLAVPIVASGPRAGELERFGAEQGMRISVLAGDPGQAARLKLVRSVYMKGRDALVVELMLAARRLGLEDAVVASIGGPAEQVPFGDLVDRLVTGVAVHAQRRSDELAASAELLETAGVEPVMARAGARVLSELGELGLREAFGGRRPDGAETVLAEVERLRGGRGPAGASSGALG